MLINILIGFLIPWIFGAFLFKKSPKIVLTISPIGTVLSHGVNALEYTFDFWAVKPIHNFENLNFLIFNIGLYSVLATTLIYIIHKKNINSALAIILFATFTTILEYLGVIVGKVIYSNGWNLFFTFCSYLIPYTLVYLYYKLLSKYNILGNRKY